jgi:antitoxin component YwqK of YwqJK toxin-antitoxin module
MTTNDILKLKIWKNDSEIILELPIISKQNPKIIHAQNDTYAYMGGNNKKMEASGFGGILKYKDSSTEHHNIYLAGTFKNGELVEGVQYSPHDGQKEFSGYFRHGKLHGRGKEYIDTGDSYIEGVFKDGKINGKGKEFLDGKLSYEGGIKDLYYEGKGKEYYENGKLHYDASWKDGRLHGKGKEFESNGKLKYEGSWKNGYYEGKGKRYKTIIIDEKYEDTYMIAKFEIGYAVGKAIEYYIDGKVASKMNYVHGRKDGKGVSYFPSGKIFKKGEWKRDRMNGKCVEYYSSGRIKKEGVFKDGRLVKGRYCDYNGYCSVGTFDHNEKGGSFKVYYPDGKLFEIATYKRDRKDGPVKIFHENGKVKFKGTYDSGGKMGRGVEYYENGKKLYEGYYDNNRRHGKGKSYFENGKLSFDGSYFIGSATKGKKYEPDGSYVVGTFRYYEPEGECAFYNPQKKLLMKGKFSYGMKNGEVKIYRPNGKLEFKGMFVENKKEGPGTEYNEQGKIVRKGFWKDDKYSGKVDLVVNQKLKRVEENSIKKFLQTNDASFLKKVSTDSMKQYLKEKANKTVTGTKPKLIKELKQWRKQVKKEKPRAEGMVFDAYEGDEVPIQEFVKDDNRILFVSKTGHYDGAYLEQCQIVYQCENDRSWRSYVGDSTVRSLIQFPTASGPKYYFETSILKDLDKGYNVFYYETDPTLVRILSKNVALGGTLVSGLHCDEKDVVKVSQIIKMEKLGEGLTKTVTLEY